MKIAQCPDSQQPLLASNAAPEKALCPYCEGVVTLRRRKLMNNGGYAYFWRHQDNRNRTCNGRSRPVQSAPTNP